MLLIVLETATTLITYNDAEIEIEIIIWETFGIIKSLLNVAPSMFLLARLLPEQYSQV